MLSHITLQHSVGQLSSRLLDDLADFLQLFLYLCRLGLGVLVLSANERHIERRDRRGTLVMNEKVFYFVARIKSMHTAAKY